MMILLKKNILRFTSTLTILRFPKLFEFCRPKIYLFCFGDQISANSKKICKQRSRCLLLCPGLQAPFHLPQIVNKTGGLTEHSTHIIMKKKLSSTSWETDIKTSRMIVKQFLSITCNSRHKTFINVSSR